MDSPQRKKTNKIKIVSNYDGILPTNEHLEEEKCDKVHYDEISAARYEQFEVIKVNAKGKKQNRILGIDSHKIYN